MRRINVLAFMVAIVFSGTVNSAFYEKDWHAVEKIDLGVMQVKLMEQRAAFTRKVLKESLVFRWRSANVYSNGRHFDDEFSMSAGFKKDPRSTLVIDGEGFQGGGCDVVKGNRWLYDVDTTIEGHRLVTAIAYGSKMSVCGFSFSLSGSKSKILKSNRIKKYLVK